MAVVEGVGANGLPTLVVTDGPGSRAEVYLHGAHVTSWIPAGGTEALFVSREALLDGRSPIRGGVPVVFPQFADRGPLPKHGFARVQPWRPIGDEGDARAGRVRLELRDSAETRALWPHAFRAELGITLAGGGIELSLGVENTGDSSFSFTAALHTYLRVADVRRIGVAGLQGVRYIDKVAGGVERVEESAAVAIAGEVDRVYLGATRPVRVDDPAGGRVLAVQADDFPDVVVWNPWAEQARAFSDFGDDEYLEMVCVEAARIGVPVELPPGGSWRAAQRVHVAEGPGSGGAA